MIHFFFTDCGVSMLQSILWNVMTLIIIVPGCHFQILFNLSTCDKSCQFIVSLWLYDQDAIILYCLEKDKLIL